MSIFRGVRGGFGGQKSSLFLRKSGLKSTGNLGPPPGSVGPPKRVPPSELFVINFVGEVRSGGPKTVG